MKEIFKNLYVGNQDDFNMIDDEAFSLCLCAKTFHKLYARLDGADYDGYSGNMANTESEYLVADRPENHMIVFNMIDVDSPKFFSPMIFEKALKFITKEIGSGRKVLVCCNQGKSRSASIALMWLISKTNLIADLKVDTFEELEYNYRKVYPDYEPKEGVRYYVKGLFEELVGGISVGENS